MKRPSVFARIGIALIVIGALMEVVNFFEAKMPDSDLVSSEVHKIDPAPPAISIMVRT